MRNLLKLRIGKPDEDRFEKGRALAGAVEEKGDGVFIVASQNGEFQDYRVELKWINKELHGFCACKDFNLRLKPHTWNGMVQPCKHIWAVIHYRDAQKSEEGSPQELSPSPPSTAEQVPEEVVDNSTPPLTDERFRDLPQFGVMIYQGKHYVTKDGLLWGLYQKFPNAQIESGVIIFGDQPGYWAKVTDPDTGRSAMGHGFPRAGRNPISQLPEMAETRAINRAIRHLLGWPTSIEELDGG